MKKVALMGFLILLILTQKSMAQKPAVLNHIAVYVSNLQKSAEFYEKVFSLQTLAEPFHDGKHAWFSLGEKSALHIIQGAKSNQVFDRNDHLCFSVASLDEFISLLKQRNIIFEDWPGKAGAITTRVDGVKQIYFQDPDGHWLEVNDAK